MHRAGGRFSAWTFVQAFRANPPRPAPRANPSHRLPMSVPLHCAALADNTCLRSLPFWSVLSLAWTKRRKGFSSCLGCYVTLTVEEDGQEEHYEAVSFRRCNA
jgi:hypothetical protein